MRADLEVTEFSCRGARWKVPKRSCLEFVAKIGMLFKKNPYMAAIAGIPFGVKDTELDTEKLKTHGRFWKNQ